MNHNDFTIESPTGEPEHDERLIRETLAYLAREEALHCIQIASLTASLTAGVLAESPHGTTTFLVARRGNAVVGAGSITGAFHMMLSRVADDGMPSALVDELLIRETRIPGVMGNDRDAQAFANAWSARTGARIVPGMRQAIMECREVRPPRGVRGTWQRAGEDDWAWILPWLREFADEAEHTNLATNPDAGEAILSSVQPPGGMFVWRNAEGQPVSFAGYKGQTLNGVRIGPVYTHPDHRRHGYGSAVTAIATQALRDEGHRFVCLYTDLANPTSNHIYAGIGYEPVATSVVLRFA